MHVVTFIYNLWNVYFQTACHLCNGNLSLANQMSPFSSAIHMSASPYPEVVFQLGNFGTRSGKISSPLT